MIEAEEIAELRDQCESVEQLIERLPENATVLDVGCFGWRLAELASKHNVQLVGADLTEPPGRPRGVRYASIEDNEISMPRSLCDLVVASHVIEHVVDPMQFMSDLVRVTKPGGLIFIEAPSELGCISESSSTPSDHRFSNFWDDPTHVRPWTPAALYRLALSCQVKPMSIQRAEADGIPIVRMVAEKPAWVVGVGRRKYVSLRGVEPGLQNAWKAVWGDIKGEEP